MKSSRELEEELEAGLRAAMKAPTPPGEDALERAVEKALSEVSVNDASPRSTGRDYDPVSEGGGGWI